MKRNERRNDANTLSSRVTMNSLVFCVLVSVVLSPLCVSYTRSIRKTRVAYISPKVFPLAVSSTATKVLSASATSTSTQSTKCSSLGHGNKKKFTRLFSSNSGISAKPTIKNIDENENLATIEVVLSPQQTQKAFDAACEMFNEEVKTRGYKVFQALRRLDKNESK